MLNRRCFLLGAPTILLAQGCETYAATDVADVGPLPDVFISAELPILKAELANLQGQLCQAEGGVNDNPTASSNWSQSLFTPENQLPVVRETFHSDSTQQILVKLRTVMTGKADHIVSALDDLLAKGFQNKELLIDAAQYPCFKLSPANEYESFPAAIRYSRVGINRNSNVAVLFRDTHCLGGHCSRLQILFYRQFEEGGWKPLSIEAVRNEYN